MVWKAQGPGLEASWAVLGALNRLWEYFGASRKRHGELLAGLGPRKVANLAPI